MTSAKLLGQYSSRQPDVHGHELLVSRVETSHGITTVKSELPNADSGESVFFVGGLMSGGAYEEARCSVVRGGRVGHTILHGSNGIRRAIEADAEEVVGAIWETTGDRVVHMVAHSKAARVAVRAASSLGDEVEAGMLVLVNPALERQTLPGPGRIAGVLVEGVVAGLAHPVRMSRSISRGFQEIAHRPVGVAGEMLDLLQDQDIEPYADKAREHGWEIVMVTGDFDHIVPTGNTNRAATHLHIEKRVYQHGLVNGGHLGMMLGSGFLDDVFKPVQSGRID